MDIILQKKQYSYNNKVRTLRLLEKNDFNYLVTHKQTGISRKTIKTWEVRYGSEVYLKKSHTDDALKEVDIEMHKNDINIFRKYYKIRFLLLERIIQLIPSETRIDPLISALKSISEVINLHDEDDKKNSGSMSIIDFIKKELNLETPKQEE